MAYSTAEKSVYIHQQGENLLDLKRNVQQNFLQTRMEAYELEFRRNTVLTNCFLVKLPALDNQLFCLISERKRDRLQHHDMILSLFAVTLKKTTGGALHCLKRRATVSSSGYQGRTLGIFLLLPKSVLHTVVSLQVCCCSCGLPFPFDASVVPPLLQQQEL